MPDQLMFEVLISVQRCSRVGDWETSAMVEEVEVHFRLMNRFTVINQIRVLELTSKAGVNSAVTLIIQLVRCLETFIAY